MPHNIGQWFVYICVVALGCLASWALQRWFGGKFLEPVKVELAARQRVRALLKRLEDEAKTQSIELPPRGSGNDGQGEEPSTGHLGTGLQGWVGTIEIIIYASSVVFDYPEFIAVWFATKYVAAYKTWAEEPVGRTFYNRSLFGSGLNILIGFFTGKLAVWAVTHVALTIRFQLY